MFKYLHLILSEYFFPSLLFQKTSYSVEQLSIP